MSKQYGLFMLGQCTLSGFGVGGGWLKVNCGDLHCVIAGYRT